MLMLTMCFFCCVSDTSRWSKYRLFRCYAKCGMHFIFMRFVLVTKLNVMLHGTFLNDDFKRSTSLQCWNNVATIQNNVATVL